MHTGSNKELKSAFLVVPQFPFVLLFFDKFSCINYRIHSGLFSEFNALNISKSQAEIVEARIQIARIQFIQYTVEKYYEEEKSI